MEIDIRQLRKRDFKAARKFAVEGMHLGWYAGNGLELYLYSQYFWYLEISRATRALGAYMGDRLAGVLLADMAGQPKAYPSPWYRAFVRLGAAVIRFGYRGASSAYEEANQELLEAYQRDHEPDGELNFFAVDPDITGKGIGTLLLRALEAREHGKHIYLFTDSGSTYPFYARRGFDEAGRKEIVLAIRGKEVPLTCLLFSKIL